ncbi:response regulator transcription factor [Peptoniphilus catoniae]|uniref:response regulator transcription factor n=1 Tax=Peptoniphilus catoniae TaxID=1660341 RepID=UPI0010FDC5C4|nr:response regulator transcription factor [Peptoniphilus catoniae]
MERILVIEDDTDINRLLVNILNNKYKVDSAYTAREGLLELKINSYDLILLDLILPNMTGEEFIREVRDKNDAPIIVISAKISVDTKVNVLNLGADAFIAKPFDNKEVIAQVEATIRRYKKSKDKNKKSYTLEKENLKIDTENMTASIDDKVLKLTSIEFKILKTLMENPNKIFSKENLYTSVWDDEYIYAADTVNSHISNIRNKIKKFTDRDYIETIWGMGYRIK